ncbi:single-stranded-DNA-specific exonuclease RecJ [bacterium]|nr:MAG: single-stranded-DNA-specific exonuclease RecJ [bacterium]
MQFTSTFKKLLQVRNISESQVEEFVNPKFEFQNPFKIPNMEKAVEKIQSQIQTGGWIFIHGDFDVDGVCATSTLFNFIYYDLNYKQIYPYIPSRFDEGYGLSENSLTNIYDIYKIKVQNVDLNNNQKPLLISVDCGIKDAKLIDEKWHDYFEFIITDHHTIPEILPKQAIVVHPKLKDSKLEFQEISGTTVVWYLVRAMGERLNLPAYGVPPYQGGQKYLPLVALATNCDIMPLIDENRKIVKFGLEEIRNMNVLNLPAYGIPPYQGGLLGLFELCKVSGVETKSISSYDLGFKLGPRINAAGRLTAAIDAVRLFTTLDLKVAKQIAIDLNSLNSTRQQITETRLQEAKAQVTPQVKNNNKILIIIGEDWEEGIIGLVAGKLCEEYFRPTIVLSKSELDSVGSCRSTKHLNITETLNEVSSFLTRYGGHAQAAGLSIENDKLDEFQNAILKLVNEKLSDELIIKPENIDLELEADEITLEFAKELELFEPFGMGNSKPKFSCKNLKINSIETISGKHLKLYFDKFSAIGFNLANSNYSKFKQGDKIDLKFNLDIDTWNGNLKLSLKIVKQGIINSNVKGSC